MKRPFKIGIVLALMLLIVVIQIHAEQTHKKMPEMKGQVGKVSAVSQVKVAPVKPVKAMPKDDYYIKGVKLKKEYQKYLYEQCRKRGVSYEEALAVMSVENPTFNPKARSKNSNGTTDYGLFQINSIHIPWLSQALNITDLNNPYQNIKAGVYKLSKLNKKFSGHKKYMAYNFGVSGMKKAVSRGYSSSRYSRKVMAQYMKIKKMREIHNAKN